MRRIQRDSRYEEVVKALTSGEKPIFKDIWRVLLFASMLGHKAGEKAEIQNSDSGKAFPESYLGNCPSWPGILYLLGLSETESAEILRSDTEEQDKLIDIFEQHATAGLEKLDLAIKTFDRPLDAVVHLLSEDPESSETAVDFSGI
ncbi:MAG: DNA phosphorothioation-associated protein 4 [Verrucomicrobiales bacterium]|nr:DNA phosphorothioation-associated protein 4 [Verrucomicrobiales bacterium]